MMVFSLDDFIEINTIKAFWIHVPQLFLVEYGRLQVVVKSLLRCNLNVLLDLQVNSVSNELLACLFHPFGTTTLLHHTLALVLLIYNLRWPEPD